MSVLTLVIEGQDVAGPAGSHHPPGRSRERHRPSPPSAISRASPTSAPAASAWSRWRDSASCFPACVTVDRGGDEGDGQLRPSDRIPPPDRRAALHRAQPRLLGVRGRSQLRAAGPLGRSSALTHFDLPQLHPKATVDATHERFGIDHNRCILCTRCVRVCDEVEGAHTWDVMGRGTEARIITDLGTPWGQSATCTSCGKCVQVCPTGALFEKGRSVGEARRRRPYLPYLVAREGRAR